MKNIPRIFIDQEINQGQIVPIDKALSHYLTNVMRTKNCLCFNSGIEFHAMLTQDGRNLIIGEKTNHTDPSGDITLFFAPIKKLDDLLNMATQMGVACFQPVITERTVAHHVNWERMQKIVIEASEQSNRNSIPKIYPPVKFSELDLKNICFADERFAYGKEHTDIPSGIKSVFIGPEGGFSDTEFAAFDRASSCGISLGKTILRAEVAAVVAIGKITK
ncbi:MAG: 16S rRNA (uracil(1498)-N(3))-methyltransferase [Alphaproteobacteria bacterium]|nr:16S rRNA (uracil(1498)-N(3))-methyltransferase [Alphaproteobacteria bacterium]